MNCEEAKSSLGDFSLARRTQVENSLKVVEWGAKKLEARGSR